MTPYIAPFRLTVPLTLTPMPNGGWVIEQRGELGCGPTPLGAFSSAVEMMAALTDALCLRHPDAAILHVEQQAEAAAERAEDQMPGVQHG